MVVLAEHSIVQLAYCCGLTVLVSESGAEGKVVVGLIVEGAVVVKTGDTSAIGSCPSAVGHPHPTSAVKDIIVESRVFLNVVKIKAFPLHVWR